jgi:hypothetical protein
MFSTYLGGSGYDCGNGIDVDKQENIYVIGDTTSSKLCGLERRPGSKSWNAGRLCNKAKPGG